MEHDDRLLADRRKALEEAFFQKQNEKLKAKLRAATEREASRRELRGAFPLAKDEVIERFIDHGLDVEAVSALGLVPCVMVAWADGELGEREREAVLAAARENGLDPSSRPYALLASWLAEPPSAELIDLWSHYVLAACKGLTPDERSRMRERVVSLAQAVARATGGFLGFGDKISDAEQVILDRIEQAFRG